MADTDTKQALAEVRAKMPEHGKVLAKKLFTDTLVPAAGNLNAYNDFLTRHADHQFHVHLDNNDFGLINKLHGDLAGDDALRVFGTTASKISRKHRGKFFHVHGDEWKAAFDSLDQAKGFVSELHNSISKTNLGLPN